jgi:AsmA protein
MKRLISGLIKIVLGVVFLIALLLGLLLLAGYYYLDPNLYTDQIISWAKEETGRELTINSRIEKSIYPFLGLKLGEMSLGNAEGFPESTPFVEIKKVEIGVRLLPIFRGRVEADKIRVSGLELNLGKNSEGVNNWDDLLELVAQTDAESDDTLAQSDDSESPTTTTESEKASPLTFYFQGVELVNASFSWHDATTGQALTVSDFNVIIPLKELHHPFPINVKGDFALQPQNLSGQLQFNTQVHLESDFTHVELNALDLKVEVQGDGLPEKGVSLTLQAAAKYNIDSKRGALDPLTLSLAGMNWIGSIEFNGEAPSASGRLTLDEINPRSSIAAWNIPLPEMGSEEALSQLSAEIAFQATPLAINVEIPRLNLDQTTLHGSLAAILGDPLGYRFDLEIDQLNLDHYLPPKTDEVPDAKEAEEPFSLDPEIAELIQKLDLNGELRLGTLTLQGLKIENLALKLKAAQGEVQIGPLSADLYDGRVEGVNQLNFRSLPPRYNVNQSLKGFQIGPFTRDLIGEEKVSGTTDLAIAVRSEGLDLEEMKRALNGEVNFSLANGAVSGINIAHLIRTAQAKLKGEAEKPSEEPLETDFTALTGTLHLKDGVVENNDLSAYSPLLRVNGNGKLNLISEEVDYLLTTSVVGTVKGQGGAELNELRGISIPIRLRGAMLEPKFSLDLKAALQQKAVDKLKPQIEEKKEAIQEEIKSRLPKQLKGLIK